MRLRKPYGALLKAQVCFAAAARFAASSLTDIFTSIWSEPFMDVLAERGTNLRFQPIHPTVQPRLPNRNSG
jgi:hypothetical protein